MEYITSFRLKSLDERQTKYMNLRKKYPDRFAFVIDRADSKGPEIDSHLFLVPSSTVLSTLQIILRSRVKLNQTNSLFLFVTTFNNEEKTNSIVLSQPSKSISQIWKQYASNDGFVYIVYALENAFG
jgi:microtubule-associated protein 1 light chain